MKHLLTSDLRRAKDVLVRTVDAACDVKRAELDNLISLYQIFNCFANLFALKHDLDANAAVRYLKENDL